MYEYYKDHRKFYVNTDKLINLGYKTDIEFRPNKDNPEESTIELVSRIYLKGIYNHDVVKITLTVSDQVTLTSTYKEFAYDGPKEIPYELSEEETIILNKIAERLKKILPMAIGSKNKKVKILQKSHRDKYKTEPYISIDMEKVSDAYNQVIYAYGEYFRSRGMKMTNIDWDSLDYGHITFEVDGIPEWKFGLDLMYMAYENQLDRHDDIIGGSNRHNYVRAELYAQNKIWIDKFKASRSEFTSRLKFYLVPERNDRGKIIGTTNKIVRSNYVHWRSRLSDINHMINESFKEFELILTHPEIAFYAHMHSLDEIKEILKSNIPNNKDVKALEKLAKRHYKFMKVEESIHIKKQIKADRKVANKITKELLKLDPNLDISWRDLDNGRYGYSMQPVIRTTATKYVNGLGSIADQIIRDVISEAQEKYKRNAVNRNNKYNRYIEWLTKGVKKDSMINTRLYSKRQMRRETVIDSCQVSRWPDYIVAGRFVNRYRFDYDPDNMIYDENEAMDIIFGEE